MDQLITGYLEKIQDLLSRIDEKMDSARSVVPFGSKVAVDKLEIFDIVDEIRDVTVVIQKSFPSEINNARRIVSEKEMHVDEAKKTADMIIRAAENTKSEMLDDHEITQEAKLKAKEIIDAAREEQRRSKEEAHLYFDEIFTEVEEALSKVLEAHAANSRGLEHSMTELLSEVYDSHNRLRIQQ